MYLLIPTGLEEKSSITVRFLKEKMQEYELLQEEIRVLLRETKSETKIDISGVKSSKDTIE
jgi:hypothetical protein